ncbi:MAG: hypothetical protein LBD85_03720 [Oscillospiraceae bacterium]|jgi:hypothetical protein|nr:hypothetical protein [Oscillospiraceae bacterium]
MNSTDMSVVISLICVVSPKRFGSSSANAFMVLLSLLSVEKLQRIDYTLYDIIVEEALAYLAGDKTAEDTAAVIHRECLCMLRNSDNRGAEAVCAVRLHKNIDMNL